MKFHVPDMSCGHCKAAIDTSVKGADGSAQLDFDMENGIVSVESQLSADQVMAALKTAGYDATQTKPAA
jgi:copper chaperone